MTGVGGGAEAWAKRSASKTLDSGPGGEAMFSAGAGLVAARLATVLGVPQFASLLTELILLSIASLSRVDSPGLIPSCASSIDGDPKVSALPDGGTPALASTDCGTCTWDLRSSSSVAVSVKSAFPCAPHNS